jgi:hypothetical protein
MQVGPDFPLMLDCYMALDTAYTVELARKLEPFNLKWIEEPLMPDDYEAHALVSWEFTCSLTAFVRLLIAALRPIFHDVCHDLSQPLTTCVTEGGAQDGGDGLHAVLRDRYSVTYTIHYTNARAALRTV